MTLNFSVPPALYIGFILAHVQLSGTDLLLTNYESLSVVFQLVTPCTRSVSSLIFHEGLGLYSLSIFSCLYFVHPHYSLPQYQLIKDSHFFYLVTFHCENFLGVFVHYFSFRCFLIHVTSNIQFTNFYSILKFSVHVYL